MIQIDDETHNALKKVAIERYISKKTQEFAKKFPDLYVDAGQNNVRRFIQLSLDKAKHYNMLADREVNGLQTLMHYLGWNFDNDPQYSWARFKQFPDKDPVKRHEEPESFSHLREVYAVFYQFLQDTRGDKSIFLQNAYSRWQQIDFKTLWNIKDQTDIVTLLQWLYPEKFNKVPQHTWNDVLIEANRKAMHYSLNTTAGTAIFTCLIFFHGVGVDTDPLCASTIRFFQNETVSGIRREEFLWGQLKATARGITQQLAASNGE